MIRLKVKPELLHWAGVHTYIDADMLVGRFPKYLQWENEKVRPTLKQLEKFARTVYVPIGFLFLLEPPDESVPIPNFRTVGNLPIKQPSSNLLDTDVFTRVKNRHCGFEFCPAFWDWLFTANLYRRVFSIEKVYNELLSALAKVNTWAFSQSYTQLAITTYLQVADCYLVAQAFIDGHTVVTHETPSVSTRGIKIPDACIILCIKCITPFEMLRRERVRFILATHRDQSAFMATRLV